MKEINKAMLKRLKNLSDRDLLIKAQAFKVANHVYSNNSFQRNYDTLIHELKERNLLRKVVKK